tara:strand:- start:1502 stop:1627 length:126 start_codon:yes stop_codon:yes gene_type:complete
MKPFENSNAFHQEKTKMRGENATAFLLGLSIVGLIIWGAVS